MRISIFFIVLLLSSCKWLEPKKPQLDINKMKVIVWQLMQADEYYSRASLLDTTWSDSTNICCWVNNAQAGSH